MTKVFLLFALLAVCLQEIYGHGKMLEPVNRSSAWRNGFATPPNYSDNQLFCGGGAKNMSTIEKECGVCGDDPKLPQPRPNENGGEYGTGLIVKTYVAGNNITVKIDVNANHAGHFYFALCPLEKEDAIETEDCFKQHPVHLADGRRRYKVPEGNVEITIQLALPYNFTCRHCVLRWHYRTGNSWGHCTPEEIQDSDTPGPKIPQIGESQYGELGCGPQEMFRSCSDITIASATNYLNVLKDVSVKNDEITQKLNLLAEVKSAEAQKVAAAAEELKLKEEKEVEKAMQEQKQQEKKSESSMEDKEDEFGTCSCTCNSSKFGYTVHIDRT